MPRKQAYTSTSNSSLHTAHLAHSAAGGGSWTGSLLQHVSRISNELSTHTFGSEQAATLHVWAKQADFDGDHRLTT